VSQRPAPFDGPQWEGWTKREKHNAVARGEYGTPKHQWISVIGQLRVEDEDQSVCLWFPSPEAARQVAECIITAQRGEQVGPVAEWLPIETAPKDGTWILAIIDGEYQPGIRYAPSVSRFTNGSWDYENYEDTGEEWYPTHWMPLPAPPKAKYAPVPRAEVEL
jgi:hypothetical protein